MQTSISERIEQAADAAIPKIKNNLYFPKPWWSPELNGTFNNRERAYNIWRHRKSPQNRDNFKRMQAIIRRAIKRHKKNSWEETATKMTKATPTSKVWETIRRVKGNLPRNIRILRDGNRYYTTMEGICNKLAQSFAEVSSTKSYYGTSQTHKRLAEQNKINFESSNDEAYNQLLKKQELDDILNDLRNTALGPDDINHDMIKHLPDMAKEYLLLIDNKCYTEHYYPEQWRHSKYSNRRET